MRPLLCLVFVLTACATSPGVPAHIQQHDLAGAWVSARGEYMQIGCSGTFRTQRTEYASPESHEQFGNANYLTELNDQGFTVSRFPLASSVYHVDHWPDHKGLGAVLQIDGTSWKRVATSECED